MGRDRPKRLREAKRRLDEELWTETRANAAYGHYRAGGRMKNGRRLGAHSPPKPYTPPATPDGPINLSDPDSRAVKGLRGFIEGDNAQAVTNEHRVVIAAEVMTRRRTSGTSSRCSTPPNASCAPLASPKRPGCCWRTPALRTSAR